MHPFHYGEEINYSEITEYGKMEHLYFTIAMKRSTQTAANSESSCPSHTSLLSDRLPTAGLVMANGTLTAWLIKEKH